MARPSPNDGAAGDRGCGGHGAGGVECAVTFGPSMCNIRCGKCGHVGDLELFSVSPSRYRCPSCGYRWRIETVGHATITPWGTVIPAERREVMDE